MRKSTFKKVLSIIDSIELHGISFHDLPLRIYESLANECYIIKLSELKELMDFMKEKKMLKLHPNGIDLTPAATVYSKSNQNSGLEALSLFECFLQDEGIHTFLKELMKKNAFVSKDEMYSCIDKQSMQFMLQTVLFENNQDQLRFQPKLCKGISDIFSEYAKETPLISCTITALYTSSIVSHEDLHIDYKNTKEKMNDYLHKDIILNIIPRRGIPHDRDETKALQAFYKDTLFHEFCHCCPICEINIPHMLIASHIKPFRDCAHIYEAIDHNNGLLLCRNHDYLFDQGYISFDEKGCILLSEALLHKEHIEKRFSITKSYHLPIEYLTRDRLLFLKYHREHIFKQQAD